MRKIAANYIMPVSSPPLRNGVVVIDDDGGILEVIDTGGKLRESSSLEFYNGIVTPGFVLPWYRATGQANTFTESAFRDFDLLLFQQGIKGIGILEKRACHFAEKAESPVTYHTILELCPGSDQEEFEVYQQGIDIISEAWNDFDQACSVSCCTSSLMETDLAGYILQFAATHQLVIPLENSYKWSLPEQLARLKQQMERVSEEPPEGIKLNAHLVLIHDQADLPATARPDLAELFITFHSARPKQNLNILEAMLALQELSSERSLL
ncbi:MAG: hypothetical protein KAI95_04175, partial [Bacteroidales bacterium]|nr:hypothetical protein [Bacteroidales bacterium]